MKKVAFPKVVVSKSRYGMGLFAGEDIPDGRRVIEYRGERVRGAEYQRRERFYNSVGCTYMFELGPGVALDGLIGGNESRFINHSVRRFNLVATLERGRLWFYAHRDIARGDELLLDYGFDPKAIRL